MKQVAEITLVENSSAGNPPKIFTAQTVEVIHVADTVIRSVDGRTSKGSHPSEIVWVGGTARDLHGITDVKIVGHNGTVLLEGALNTHYGAPRDISGGVTFFALRPD